MVEYEVFGCMFGYDYEDVVFWYVECVYQCVVYVVDEGFVVGGWFVFVYGDMGEWYGVVFVGE